MRISICADMSDRSEEQIKKTSKYIIFCKNVEGYKELNQFAKESTNVEYADSIDTRALRSINQILKIHNDFHCKNTPWLKSI